jgi:hypothetical protein
MGALFGHLVSNRERTSFSNFIFFRIRAVAFGLFSRVKSFNHQKILWSTILPSIPKQFVSQVVPSLHPSKDISKHGFSGVKLVELPLLDIFIILFTSLEWQTTLQMELDQGHPIIMAP